MLDKINEPSQEEVLELGVVTCPGCGSVPSGRNQTIPLITRRYACRLGDAISHVRTTGCWQDDAGPSPGRASLCGAPDCR